MKCLDLIADFDDQSGAKALAISSFVMPGASLNNISRIELMQKLARVEPPGGTLTAPSKPL